VALSALLLLGPGLNLLLTSPRAPSQLATYSQHPSSSDFTASATFQGDPISGHVNASQPIVTSFSDVFVLVFTWHSPNQATLVTKGELNVLFLGATVGTTSNTIQYAVPAENGSITLNNTAFSQDRYLFEGVYQATASLYDQGTAIWNMSFYVWIQAPEHFTVVNIALIIIILFEIYQIAALGSARAARKELGLNPPPKTES
jgi:hypothetical protein